MAMQEISQALSRVEAVLRRRPEAGLHADAPAHAVWHQGARFAVGHPSGHAVATDMPQELGGTGDQVTPGWLFRAGLASCAGTSILMAAAAEGIELTRLEVTADSRSDTRGLLGLIGADGAPAYGGPCDVALTVRIAAEGTAADRLRALVEAGVQRSPVPNAVLRATAIDLRIDSASA